MKVINIAFGVVFVSGLLLRADSQQTQVMREHVIRKYDPVAANHLLRELEQVEHPVSSAEKHEALRKILSVQDETLTSWLLSKPRFSQEAAAELKKRKTSASDIRAVCSAIRQSAVPDGQSVMHEGDADDPSLVVWSLKNLFDTLTQMATPNLQRSPDGQYHSSEVRAWYSKAMEMANTSQLVSPEIKAALRPAGGG